MLHIFTPFLPQRSKLSLMSRCFWDMGRFQNCNIWAWNLAIGQSATRCTYTLFLSQGVEIQLIFVPRAAVSKIFKVVLCLCIKFGHWPKCQKLHIPCLSTPKGVNLSTPKGVKLRLFSLYGQPFLRYGQIVKIAIFGHETWPLAKVPEVEHIPCVYPRGSKLSFFFVLRAAVSKIQANFQNCHIWAWNLVIGQSSRSCTHNLLLPQGVEIQLIFALWAAVSEIRTNFQTCHIWAWNLANGQRSRSCTYTLFLWAYFCSTGSGFRDTG